MAVSQVHNLPRPPVQLPRPYGIRVSLRASDPFHNLLGADWHRTHWYASAAERDTAMAEMSRRHEYSRATDKPSLVYAKVENLAASRGL
jgi:hypothetical protein